MEAARMAQAAEQGGSEGQAVTDTVAPPTNQSMNRDQLLQAYSSMLLIRRFEEKAGQLYGMGLIGGFCHLYIGQEAVVVGIQAALGEGDQVITSYRDHGHMLATGMEPRGVMAELTGRSGGYSKGKGGSMHMFSKEKRFFGGHGIVGAQVSLGTGLAMANWYRGNDRVSATYFGDGASNQGQVYESFNLAALMKLPCLYVIENNKYGMGTSLERSSASHDLSKNGAPWGIPGAQVDGMDVTAVKAAAETAVAHCRAGHGPFVMEVQTYRYRGHSMSDPAKYRTRDEVQKMRTERDPIEGAKHMLEALGVTEDRFKQIETGIKARVQEAADFAQSSPEPDERELWTDILVEG
jgi:pyruvate dehydrogenase E1 component alpha subunit